MFKLILWTLGLLNAKIVQIRSEIPKIDSDVKRLLLWISTETDIIHDTFGQLIVGDESF